MWDIVLFSLILVISTFAGFYSGFYFGFMKRENKPPEAMPIVSDIKELTEAAKKLIAKDKEEEAQSFYD